MWIEIAIFMVIIYVFNRLTCGYNRSNTCLVGKTAIVTGGNSGIGYQVCLNLASRGCKIIIADKDNAEHSVRNIIQKTSNSNIYYKIVNLASFKSVRKFAQEINAEESRLDILIHNAGIGSHSKTIFTEDGLEMVMQVNYYSSFLLTHLLLDLLKKTAPSRIIFTSSLLAFFGYLNENFLTNYKNENEIIEITRCYSNSKLATLMFSDMLAEKLKGSGITSNSLHPGYVMTPIFSTMKTNGFWANIFATAFLILGYWVGKDIWSGSQTTIHLATSQSLGNVSGKYFSDCLPFWKPLQANNPALAKRLWSLSEKNVGLKESEKI